MARSSIRIRSVPALEAGGSTLGNRRWMELLAQLERSRSISGAARAVGLSYKAAWDAIDAMNNLSELALVERSVGGRNGGGTRLTARGRQLVKNFHAISEESSGLITRLNARLDQGQDDLKLITRLAMQTSARNQFAGTVVRVVKGAVNNEIELQLHGGERVVAVITRHSSEQLGLKRGVAAIALIKASSIIVAVDDGAALQLSARNVLPGTIARVSKGPVNSEVVMALQGGNSLAAVVTHRSVTALKLKRGLAVRAVFKASSVILAVSA